MTPDNIAMKRIAQKLGMNQEGVLKEALKKNNQYKDIEQWAIIHSRS